MDETIILQKRRLVPRLFLKAQANLRLRKGMSLRGKTESLHEGGCLFIPNFPDSDVEIDDEGTLNFTIRRNQQDVFAEIPSRVIRLLDEGLELAFDCNGTSVCTSDTVRAKSSSNNFLSAGRRVFVHRRKSQGRGFEFEDGWEILPGTAPLPSELRQELMVKQTDGICIVCHKIGPNGQMFKVYYALDLLAIQLMAATSGD